MRNYTQFFDDPDEEERFNLEHMTRFAAGGGGGPEPLHLSEQEFLYDDQPDPDVERAAQVLEAPGRAGPTPRELEDDAIRAVRDSYGQKRGFFEDAAPAAIALGIDALFNKARGAGAIVGGYGQGVMRRDAQDKDSMRQLAQLEIMRSREAAEDAHRKQQYELGEGNLKARNEENRIALERLNAQKGDPAVDRAYKEALTNEAEARAYQQWTKDPNAIDAETQARLQQQKEIHAEDLAEKRAGRQATEDYRAELAAQRAATTKEKTDIAAGNKFLDATREILPQAQALQAIEPTIEKYGKGTDMPGVGWFDSNVPSWLAHPIDSEKRQDADNIDRMARQAQAYFKHEITGAAGTNRETVLYEQLKGLNGTEEQFRNALKFWQDDLRAKIRGRASVAPEVSRQALDAQGLGQWTYGDEPAPPPAAQLDDPSARQPVRLGNGAPPAPRQANMPLDVGGSYRGTPGFPGSADPVTTTPNKPKQLDESEEAIRRRLLQGGIDFRWEE
jgi:hypothetical protein